MTEERKQRIQSVISKRQFGLGIVLENVNDPHNISAVMRSCDAVGVQHVYILNTKTPRFKKNWKHKSASSATKWLSISVYDSVEECFTHLKSNYDCIFSTMLGEESKSIYDTDFTSSVAIVFGNEHSGVSNEVQSYVDKNILIPQVGIVQSLNISVSCAVVLYEAFRQKYQAGHYLATEITTSARKKLAMQWGVDHKIVKK